MHTVRAKGMELHTSARNVDERPDSIVDDIGSRVYSHSAVLAITRRLRRAIHKPRLRSVPVPLHRNTSVYDLQACYLPAQYPVATLLRLCRWPGRPVHHVLLQPPPNLPLPRPRNALLLCLPARPFHGHHRPAREKGPAQRRVCARTQAASTRVDGWWQGGRDAGGGDTRALAGGGGG